MHILLPYFQIRRGIQLIFFYFLHKKNKQTKQKKKQIMYWGTHKKVLGEALLMLEYHKLSFHVKIRSIKRTIIQTILVIPTLDTLTKFVMMTI